MPPIENGPRFLLLETSPETLSLVQRLDFSSFADSEVSEDACSDAIDVHSASDDPFDSDDLEEILKICPPRKAHLKPPVALENPVKTKAEALSQTTADVLHKQLLLPLILLAQNTRQKTEIQVHSLPVVVEPKHESALVNNTISKPWPEFNSQELYLSCKLEPQDGLLSSPRKFLPVKETAPMPAKVRPTEIATPDVLFSSLHHLSAHFSPPKIVLSPAVKRPRFSSPIKFQSYESQMQFRQFSTANAPLMHQVTVPDRKVNPPIQLATQKPNLIASSSESYRNENTAFPTVAKKRVTAIRPSREQNHVLELAKEGKSIFFTGSAGTGKSFLLKSLIKELKQIKGPATVAVTASTGLAACNIGGITLHSFAGIGLGKGPLDSLIRTVKKNRKAFLRWKDTKVLIIDEISMIDGRLFHNLDQIARKIRRNNMPFGGIQVIICGDFYQLPPVCKNEVLADGSLLKDEAVFAFESKAWDEVLDHSIVLKEVFRQKGDQEFIEMLNNMRHGIVTPEAEAEFNRLLRPLECPEGIVPTELYATRVEVDRANTLKLQRIEAEVKHYVASDGGSLPAATRAQMLNNFLAPRELILKENAQVMCIKNIDDTLVNGSLGKIIKFVDRDTYLCEKIEKEKPDLSLKEFTEEFAENLRKMHPADGKSDSVFNFLVKKFLSEEQKNESIKRASKEADLEDVKVEQCSQTSSDIFEDGSSFVPIIHENTSRKLSFIEELQKTSKGEKYPLVRFICPDGVTTRDHLMEPERWDIIDDKTNEVLVYRVQFPLMLAWALSIHKSQGQTLQKVRVDLSRIFENGQAYVALSRAVSREGLQVLNFRKERVRSHPVVETFYRSLVSTEEIPEKISRSWLP